MLGWQRKGSLFLNDWNLRPIRLLLSNYRSLFWFPSCDANCIAKAVEFASQKLSAIWFIFYLPFPINIFVIVFLRVLSQVEFFKACLYYSSLKLWSSWCDLAEEVVLIKVKMRFNQENPDVYVSSIYYEHFELSTEPSCWQLNLLLSQPGVLLFFVFQLKMDKS